MKTFDVQSIEISVAQAQAFAFIANPANLPRWTNAFATVSGGAATLRTPNGEVKITLAVRASQEFGTIDWFMTFPDSTLATAFSRLVATADDRCVYSFVLTPPPVPLAQLEGALDAQSKTLAEELVRLKSILAAHE